MIQKWFNDDIANTRLGRRVTTTTIRSWINNSATSHKIAVWVTSHTYTRTQRRRIKDKFVIERMVHAVQITNNYMETRTVLEAADSLPDTRSLWWPPPPPLEYPSSSPTPTYPYFLPLVSPPLPLSNPTPYRGDLRPWLLSWSLALEHMIIRLMSRLPFFACLWRVSDSIGSRRWRREDWCDTVFLSFLQTIKILYENGA